MAITLKGLKTSTSIATSKKVVNQVVVKPESNKLTLKVNSLADLAKVAVTEKGFSPKRFSGIVIAINDKHYVVKNSYDQYTVNGEKKPINTVTLVPIGALQAKLYSKISYEMTKNTAGKNVPTNFVLEKDVTAAKAVHNLIQEITSEVRILTMEDMAAYANGARRTPEFDRMSNTEQEIYVTEALRKITGEILLARSFRGTPLFVCLGTATNVNTATATANSASATNNADTTTTANTDTTTATNTVVTTVAA